MKKTLIVLGIISALAFSTVANADTGFIDTNGDGGSEQWTLTGQSGLIDHNWQAVGGQVRQPGTPKAYGTGPYFTPLVSTANPNVKTDIYAMTTLTGVGTVTNIVVWSHGEGATEAAYAGYGAFTKVSVGSGASWTTLTDFGFSYPKSWKSVSFNGSWNQADLDAMQVKIVSSYTSGMTPYPTKDYAVYAVVTFTAGGGEPPAGGGTQAYFIRKKKGIVFFK